MEDVQRQIEIPSGLHGKQRKLAKFLLKKGMKRFIPVQLQLPKKARITNEEILTDVVFADLLKTSVEVVGSNFEGPSQDRIMDYLQELTPECLEELGEAVGKEASYEVRKLRRTSYNVAIDFTYIPYYGDPDNPYITAIKHTRGTSYAFVFCVAGIVVDGIRRILYLHPVTKATNKVMYHVGRAVNFIRRLGIRISILTLDREFYVEEVVNFLNEGDVHYIIPAIQTERFLRYAKQYSTFPHSLPVVLEDWEVGKTARTTLAIIEEKDAKGESHIYGFITNLPKERYKDDITVLSELYSKRWGIETTFRVEDKFDIYTTTRNGVLRYFFFLVSCILYNLWVKLNFIGKAGNVDNGSFEIGVKVDELRIVLIHLFSYKLRRQKFNKICELLAAVIEENARGYFLCLFLESRTRKNKEFNQQHEFLVFLSQTFSSKSWKAL